MRTGLGSFAAAVAVVVSLAVTGCSSGAGGTSGSSSGSGTSSASSGAPTGSVGSTTAQSVRVVRTLAGGLQVPWGIAFLPDGSALVGERPTGRILRLAKDGGIAPVGTAPGVLDLSEGGLLGLALAAAPPGLAPSSVPSSVPSGSSSAATIRASSADPLATGSPPSSSVHYPVTLFAYLTSKAGDNRVVRMSFDGARLGPSTPVLTGIGSADHHNGGLLTVGPDGKLWIGTGDAGVTSRSQDRLNLGGKILRINLDGSIPADNPFPGSPVYSLGHRNVQGLAFDSSGQPWAVEFGQNTWDELNRIVPGGNYGWPVVEGKQPHPGFIEPLVQWHTNQASPSGMTIVRDVAYIGALRGERLWRVPLHGTTTGAPQAFPSGQFGRIRNVARTPGGGLWITTSNRDGRGEPGPDDDRVIELALS